MSITTVVNKIIHCQINNKVTEFIFKVTFNALHGYDIIS